jgi:hypothetical protein
MENSMIHGKILQTARISRMPMAVQKIRPGSQGKLVHPAPLKGQHWMIPSPGESSGVDEYMVYSQN